MRSVDTWARKIEKPADLPKIFRDSFPGEPAGAFPYTIFAPADRWGFRKVHPKLLYILNGHVSCWELGKEGIARRAFPFADVTSVEMGRILLHAWIRIEGISAGKAASFVLEFNSVVEDLFRPVAETIRTAAAGIPPAGEDRLEQERRKLDFLAETSYKFANFAKLSLLPGEQVLAAVFAPEIKPQGILGGLRAGIPAHLAVLTDRELILIDDGRHRGAGEAYGGIWRYVPLGKIEQLSVDSESGGNLLLSLRLAGGARLGSRFAAVSEEGLARLVEAYPRRI